MISAAFKPAVGGSASTTISYLLTDHLGGTNVVTNASGSVVQTLDYYPYGAPRIKTGTDISQREYIGEHYDESSGLNYLNARYYDGSRGQFISQDPVFWGDPLEQNLENPQSLNSYGYANGNPISNKDPSGESALDVIVGLLNAFNSNAAFGAGRIAPQQYGGNQADYARGQLLGDLVSALVGAVQTFIGASIAASGGGLTVSSGGTLGAVGVPAAALGSTVAYHGASQSSLGAYNFAKGLQGGSRGPNDGSKSIGERIADGHAFNKHAKEFGPGVTREQFAKQADNIINSPSEVKSFGGDKKAYWDNKSGTVVIRDPKSVDGGTMFRPTQGKAYFDRLK